VDDASYVTQVNDAYRALGRHVVKFSMLISRMRWLVSWRVALHSTEPYNYAEMLFLEAAAGRISDVFFGLCQIIHKYDPDTEELEVAGKLQAEVARAVKYRNRLAHGDWWVGYLHGSEDPERIEDPAFTVLKRLSKTDTHFAEDEFVPVADLDAKTDRLVELTALVTEFGYLALELPIGVLETKREGETVITHSKPGTEPSTRYRVGEVFGMAGRGQHRRLVRNGTKAGVLPAWKLQLL
jgi:hypothetical protein